MNRITVFFLLWVPVYLGAQDCDCSATFRWMKDVIENNDAGFAYALSLKGEDAYEQHTATLLPQIQATADPQACAEILNEWLFFLRKGHIGIEATGTAASSENTPGQRPPSKDEIRASFADWKTYPLDLKALKSRLKAQTQPTFEGIWESPPYKIGIVKEGEDYVGAIIKADGVYWQKDQVKLQIKSGPNGYTGTFYMRDHSPREISEVKLLGSNYLIMDFVELKRSSSQFPSDPRIDRYFELIGTDKPLFEQIDPQTCLLRIPSFNRTELDDIQAVVDANREAIMQTETLLIDLRNNGGGSDVSYYALLPFLYTNPIRTVNMEMYSTELNNSRILGFINSDELNFTQEDKVELQMAYDSLSKHVGEFVNLSGSYVDVDTMDSVYPYPKQVGILINENNGSTTEQFLLAAKQSTKVKLFGTTTAGVLDISNMMLIPSPCGNYQLGYSLSKSLRIPDMAIDGKGIQPDYYIDKGVAPYEWVPFAQRILNGQ